MQRRTVQSAMRSELPDRIALASLLLPALVLTVWGAGYYFASTAERVRAPLHVLLKPSGVVGQGFGIAGLTLFLFMWLYPLRKKLRWLGFTGSVGSWMRIHTVIGLALPILVAVHAAWRFQGLIGLGYWAMLLVSLSGLVGRYLYVRIPRSRNGLELTRDEVAGQSRTLVTEIAVALGRDPAEIARTLEAALIPPRTGGFWRTVTSLVASDLQRWRAVRRLRQEWGPSLGGRASVPAPVLNRAIDLARREIALGQQVRFLDSTHRLFAFWHVAHRPVAITALLAVLVHVTVAIVMGQTWLR
jgi:hypothetical protein